MENVNISLPGTSVVLYPVTLADTAAARSCAKAVVDKGVTVYVINITGDAETDAAAAANTAKEKGSRYIGVYSDKAPTGTSDSGFPYLETLLAVAPVYFFVSAGEGIRKAYSVTNAGVFELSEGITDTALAVGTPPHLKSHTPQTTANTTPIYGKDAPPPPEKNKTLSALKKVGCGCVSFVALFIVCGLVSAVISCAMSEEAQTSCSGAAIFPHEEIDVSPYSEDGDGNDSTGDMLGALMDTPSDNMGYDDDGLLEEQVDGDYIYAQCISGEYKGLAYIDRYTGSEKEVTLPETLGGIKVISVSVNAFKENGTIERLTVPEGYVDISYNAFAKCDSLKSVRLPATLKTIEQGAFSGCSALEDINFPENIEKIGSFAFYGCSSLRGELVLPERLETLDSSAFGDCTGIESVILPEGLRTAGQNAFIGCTSLGYVSAPGITEVSAQMFSGCGSLKKIDLGEDAVSIGVGSFLGCGFDEFTVPVSVKTVKSKAFTRCENLKKVSMPASLSDIESDAFMECHALESFSLYGDGGRLSVKDDVLFSGNGSELLCFPLAKSGSYTVPDGVTAIAKYAFYEANVDNVALPNTLREIGEDAFCGTGIASITIHDSVKVIDSYAFSHCPSLREAHIGKAGQIGYNIFYDCKELEKITVSPGGGCRIEDMMLIEIGTGTLVSGLYGLSGDISVPDGVKIIGADAFADNTGIVSVSLPSSLEEIEYGAFYRCSSLENVSFGGNEKTIGSQAFCGCESLREIILPDGVEYLSNGVFSGCKGLEHIYLGRSITELRSGTLCNCTSLKRVEIPYGVTSIKMAFENCESLESIYIPDSVVSIDSAFKGCSSLERVVLSDNIERMDILTFRGCVSLKEMYFPKSHEFYISYIEECPNIERIYYGGTELEWQSYLHPDPDNRVMPEGVEIIYESKKPSK